MKKIVNYKRFSKKLKKSKRGADKPRWFVRLLVLTFVKNKNKNKKKLSIRSRKWVGVKQGKSS